MKSSWVCPLFLTYHPWNVGVNIEFIASWSQNGCSNSTYSFHAPHSMKENGRLPQHLSFHHVGKSFLESSPIPTCTLSFLYHIRRTYLTSHWLVWVTCTPPIQWDNFTQFNKSDTGLTALHLWTHLIIITIQGGRYCNPHLTDQHTQAQSLGNMPRLKQMVPELAASLPSLSS